MRLTEDSRPVRGTLDPALGEGREERKKGGREDRKGTVEEKAQPGVVVRVIIPELEKLRHGITSTSRIA